MPAYMIVTCNIRDRERFINGYGAVAAKLVEQHGGRYLLRAPGAELLEGEIGASDFGGASMVISQWPDKAAVHRFWNSPEYAEARKLREGIATCQVLLVEGAPLG